VGWRVGFEPCVGNLVEHQICLGLIQIFLLLSVAMGLLRIPTVHFVSALGFASFASFGRAVIGKLRRWRAARLDQRFLAKPASFFIGTLQILRFLNTTQANSDPKTSFTGQPGNL
jgi:hypothetical protein